MAIKQFQVCACCQADNVLLLLCFVELQGVNNRSQRRENLFYSLSCVDFSSYFDFIDCIQAFLMLKMHHTHASYVCSKISQAWKKLTGMLLVVHCSGLNSFKPCTESWKSLARFLVAAPISSKKSDGSNFHVRSLSERNNRWLGMKKRATHDDIVRKWS